MGANRSINVFSKCGLLYIACGLSLVAGCNTEPPTTPLRSEVTVSPSTVAPGGSFTVTITLTNETDRTLIFVGSSSCRATFEVLSGETVVGVGPNACTDDLARLSLEPDETLTVDHPSVAVDLDDEPLEGGTYQIRAVAEVAEPEVIAAEGPTADLIVTQEETEETT
jgi:hypothetical protein